VISRVSQDSLITHFFRLEKPHGQQPAWNQELETGFSVFPDLRKSVTPLECETNPLFFYIFRSF
jgi:hypothetical protein